MWRRRSAVEHALRVASELYAEAEAAAMQAYAHTQQKAGSAHNAWWKDQGPSKRPTLTAAQREEVRVSRPACASRLRSLTGLQRHQVIARLLSERAALAEADLLVYARHSAAWSEFIALNPLVAAAAQLAQQDRVRCLVPVAKRETAEAARPRFTLQAQSSPSSQMPLGATAASPDPTATQAIRDGRRYLYSSPLRPLVARGPSPQAESPQGGAGNPQELAGVREELLRSRRRCVELARAEREAREELQSLAAAYAAAEAGSANMRPELLAAEAGLTSAVTAVENYAAQAAAEREVMMARVSALRSQLTLFREATEQLRWDASAATESTAGEKVRLLERCAAIEAASQAVLSSAAAFEPGESEDDEVQLMRRALQDAEAQIASLRGQRDAAVARASHMQSALTSQTAEATDALDRLTAAESAAASAAAAQRAMEITAMHAAEAARASAAERAALAQANVALQSQLDQVRRSLQKLPSVEPGAPPRAPSVASAAPRSEVDWMSEAGGFSESGSAFGDGADLAALRLRRERQRDEARARAAQNRAKFEALKAERNALKVESRRSAAELGALRAEAARVEELQTQLRTIQSTLFL